MPLSGLTNSATDWRMTTRQKLVSALIVAIALVAIGWWWVELATSFE
jgi:hypothetical protein